MVLWQLTSAGPVADLRIRIEGIVFDNKIRLLPPWPSSEANIQIVAIDEKSLTQIGRMPWDRNEFARINTELASLGAAVVVYDVLFSESQTNPALELLEKLPTETPQADYSELFSQFNYDGIFADSLSQIDSVLAMQLLGSDKKANTLPEQYLDPNDFINSQTDFLTKNYRGYAAPIESFASVATGIGFMNSMPDEDGTIRRSPLFLRVDDKLFPSLALEAYHTYSLFDKVEPIIKTNQDLAFLVGFKLGHRIINTDELGQMLIPYQGKSAAMHNLPDGYMPPYPYTSASDVMNRNISDERFDQAVVFVGATAIGLGDLQVTPVGINYPGVEIHATIFDALMSSKPLPSKPDWELGALTIMLVSICILALVIYPRTGPWMTLFVGFLTVASSIIFNSYLWQNLFIDLSLFPVLLLSILLTFYYVARGFLSESAQRNQVKQMFGQYVPSAHIDRLLADPLAITFDGERKELSVMFSDIRNFTSISESMTAEQLKLWLNQFFTPVTQAILQHEGTIDKYVGDMIMAFWGAPLEDPRHASHSINAAFSMLDKIALLNKEFAASGSPLAHVGIGISTGDMNVGDMGSSFRRAYTVIGDTVNLGSRLEGLTKFYGLTILVSEKTKEQATDFKYIMVDKVKVKGKMQSVSIYTPTPSTMNNELSQDFDLYTQGIEAYFNRDFRTAITSMSELIEKKDFPYQTLLNLILERAEHFTQEPPAEDWDGSFQHTSK